MTGGMERLSEIEERARKATPGHSETRIGAGITVGCITPEARGLLDAAHAGWLEHRARVAALNPGYPKDDAYSALYWLIRWSGLVDPAAREDVPALCKALRVALEGLAENDCTCILSEADGGQCAGKPYCASVILAAALAELPGAEAGGWEKEKA